MKKSSRVTGLVLAICGTLIMILALVMMFNEDRKNENDMPKNVVDNKIEEQSENRTKDRIENFVNENVKDLLSRENNTNESISVENMISYGLYYYTKNYYDVAEGETGYKIPADFVIDIVKKMFDFDITTENFVNTPITQKYDSEKQEFDVPTILVSNLEAIITNTKQLDNDKVEVMINIVNPIAQEGSEDTIERSELENKPELIKEQNKLVLKKTSENKYIIISYMKA